MVALFIGSLVVFLSVSVALGLSVLTRGQALKIGCGSLSENPDCKHGKRGFEQAGSCGGVCRREKL